MTSNHKPIPYININKNVIYILMLMLMLNVDSIFLYSLNVHDTILMIIPGFQDKTLDSTISVDRLKSI